MLHMYIICTLSITFGHLLFAAGDVNPAETKVVVTAKCGEMAGDIPATSALMQDWLVRDLE